MAGGKLRDQNTKESWALLEDLALYYNEIWNNPRDFSKPIKAITFPQDVLSTSDRRLIELENQVQRLTKAHLAPTQPTQVNKITTPCEICIGPHDTQYCMEDLKQAFVEYAYQRSGSFMASQDAKLSKFEADFKQQKNEMTNKIDTVLKAITDRIAGTLHENTVKNLKLSISLVSSAGSYPTTYPQCSIRIHGSINAITIHLKKQGESHNDEPDENEEGDKDNPKNIHVNPSVPPDPSILFITEKVLKLNSFFESLGLVPQSSNTELFAPKGMTMINFTFVTDFMIIEDISPLTNPRILQVVLGKPFVDILNMTHDLPKGVVRFTKRTDKIAYKIRHKIEQYDSLSNLEKDHTKSVYLRNDEDRRRGVMYVMSKILGFYKECLELGPKYETEMDDEGEVMLYLTRRSLEVLRKFHWTILGGRFNQLSHVSSPLLSKPGEY
uniref:MAK10-like protein n=1 Tax=Tanacetum cinerariifolium TaxID=118510 RepID=A0A6L2J0L5_TANCI|nr:MAK10-like protein [Tanacetum cinerariifolium]